jgi:hypothetical protein
LWPPQRSHRRRNIAFTMPKRNRAGVRPRSNGLLPDVRPHARRCDKLDAPASARPCQRDWLGSASGPRPNVGPVLSLQRIIVDVWRPSELYGQKGIKHRLSRRLFREFVLFPSSKQTVAGGFDESTIQLQPKRHHRQQRLWGLWLLPQPASVAAGWVPVSLTSRITMHSTLLCRGGCNCAGVKNTNKYLLG